MAEDAGDGAEGGSFLVAYGPGQPGRPLSIPGSYRNHNHPSAGQIECLRHRWAPSGIPLSGQIPWEPLPTFPYSLKRKCFHFFFHNFRHRLHRKFVEVTTFVAASGEISSKWHFRFGFTVNCVPKIHWSTTAWWRHQMETFSALLALCAGNLPVPGEFPSQRPVTRNFDVFFELCPNKRLSKQWWGWWFETQSHSLWRHCNGWSEFPHTESAIQCLKYVSLSFAWTVIIYVRTVNGQWHKIVGIRNNTIKGKCRLCSLLISKLDISLLSLDIAPSQGQAKFLDDLSCLAQFPFEFPCLISQKLQWKWINTPIFRKKNSCFRNTF